MMSQDFVSGADCFRGNLPDHRLHVRCVRISQEDTMIDQSPSTSPSAADEPHASRREFVAAAVTIAAAAGAASGAQAQTPNLRFSNPPGMSRPPSYSHVVEVIGPHRTVYLAGQTGVDATARSPRASAPGRAGDGEHQDRARLGRRRLRARGQAQQLPDQPRSERRRVSRGARLLLPEQGGASRLDPAAGPAPRQSGLSWSRSRRSRSCRRRRRPGPPAT